MYIVIWDIFGGTFMNIQKVIEKSIYIITKYYENEISYFLNSMHDDVLWLGPADNQRIESKALLVENFSKEKNNLLFSTMNMKAECVFHTKMHCEILMTFIVDSFYPDGTILRCNQRIQFLWLDTPTTDSDGNTYYEPKIRICNISNSIPYDSRDNIYPIHFTSLSFSKGFNINYINKEKMQFKGKGNTYFYLAESEIIYITNSDHYATIHTATDDFVLANSLTDIEKELPTNFVRCHISIIVNPKYVKSIQRFSITLENGVTVTIPEKKYTQVRDKITALLKK